MVARKNVISPVIQCELCLLVWNATDDALRLLQIQCWTWTCLIQESGLANIAALNGWDLNDGCINSVCSFCHALWIDSSPVDGLSNALSQTRRRQAVLWTKASNPSSWESGSRCGSSPLGVWSWRAVPPRVSPWASAYCFGALARGQVVFCLWALPFAPAFDAGAAVRELEASVPVELDVPAVTDGWVRSSEYTDRSTMSTARPLQPRPLATRPARWTKLENIAGSFH